MTARNADGTYRITFDECGDQKNVRPGNVQKRSGEPSKRDKGHVGRVVAKECEVFQDDGGVVSKVFLGRVIEFLPHKTTSNSDKWMVRFNDKKKHKLGCVDVEARILEYDKLSEQDRVALDNGELKMGDYASHMRHITRTT